MTLLTHVFAEGAGIRLLTLGPLTNVATALDVDPSLASRIDSIWVMGGAVDVPGNVAGSPGVDSDNTAAEWNIYVDPAALGYQLSVIVRIRPSPRQIAKVADLARETPEVVECHRITGEDCFFAKAHVRDVEHLATDVVEVDIHVVGSGLLQVGGERRGLVVQALVGAERLHPLALLVGTSNADDTLATDQLLGDLNGHAASGTCGA